MTPAERAARERKQKIFVVVGGLVLVGLLAIQLPRLLGGSASESAAPVTTDTTGGTVTETTPPERSAPVPIGLSDTDRPLAASPGQLPSFELFSPKDPFVQQVDTGMFGAPGAGEQPPAGGTQGEGKGSTGSTEGSPTGFTVGGASASVTVISVNGARQALVPGAAFPAANPVFVLVAEQPEKRTVTIGIAGGAYANGSRTTKLKMGKKLVLVNTTTGARYKLVLVSVGDGSVSPDKTADKAAGPKAPAAP